MCAVAAAYWAELVADPPVWRVAAVVAIAVGCGLALTLSTRLEPRRRHEGRILRIIAVALSGVAAILVVGVPVALLAPSGWEQLQAGLARGFDGFPGGQWPYRGTDFWVRQTLLVAIPLITVPAAAFALWPAARGPGGREAAATRRAGALLLLLTLVGLAAAERPLPDPAVRGSLVLVALAVWLFLARLRPSPSAALAAGAAVLVAGLVSLPIAGALESVRPLVERETAKRSPEPRVGSAGPRRSRLANRGDRDSERGLTGAKRKKEKDAASTGPRHERRGKRSGGRGQSKDKGGGGGRGKGPRRESGNERADPEEGLPAGLIVLLTAAAVLGAALLLGRRMRRRVRRGASTADEAAELRRALERLGWSLPPKTTLAELERRLGESAGPLAAEYARRLRERRFGIGGQSAPSRLDRRALRRDLTVGHGPLGRLRGFVALPPARLRSFGEAG